MTVRRAALALLAYTVFAALATRPLLELSATHIAHDPLAYNLWRIHDLPIHGPK